MKYKIIILLLGLVLVVSSGCYKENSSSEFCTTLKHSANESEKNIYMDGEICIMKPINESKIKQVYQIDCETFIEEFHIIIHTTNKTITEANFLENMDDKTRRAFKKICDMQRLK